MKNKYFIFFIISVIIISILGITIAVFSQTKKDDLHDKINSELDYLEGKMIGMLNSLNNITFSNNVSLEQSTVKGKSLSESGNEEQGNSGSEQQSDKQSDGSGNQDTSQEESSSQQGEKGSDYTRYNVENRNILVNDDATIDWNYLKTTTEVLYSTWPTIIVDLKTANVKNEDILKFSQELDNLVVTVQKQDKKDTIFTLTRLYALLSEYTNQTTDDQKQINISYTKLHIINAYANLEDENWEEIGNQIILANEYFNRIINSVDENSSHINISKTYIAINEMNNVINLKDRKLFYLKYINLMESAMQI